jgi:predicted SAM-dependent methyltransferase
MNLDKYKNSEHKIWLNCASSVYVLEEFVNLDNHIFLRMLWAYPVIKPFLPSKYHASVEEYRKAKAKAILLRHDCRKRLWFPNESVDHILCSHFLEHVYPAEAVEILREFHRVLKTGATLHIIVPDIAVQVKQYLDEKQAQHPDAADQFIKRTLLTRETSGTLKYRVLEFQGSFGLQHRWMYDAESMTARLVNTGFEMMAENNTPSRAFRLNDEQSLHLVARRPLARRVPLGKEPVLAQVTES